RLLADERSSGHSEYWYRWCYGGSEEPCRHADDGTQFSNPSCPRPRAGSRLSIPDDEKSGRFTFAKYHSESPPVDGGRSRRISFHRTCRSPPRHVDARRATAK